MSGIYKADQVYLQVDPTDDRHATNKKWVEDNIQWSLVKYEFRRDNGLAPSQTDIVIYEGKGTSDYIVVPGNCYILKSFIKLATGTVAAGTLTMQIEYWTGSVWSTIVPSRPSLILAFTTGSWMAASIAQDADYFFTGNTQFRITFTTDGSWSPSLISLEAALYILVKNLP
jgi:hypothetical protein